MSLSTECKPISDEVTNLRSLINILQDELRTAPPSHKPFLIRQIRKFKSELGEKEDELAQCMLDNPGPQPLIVNITGTVVFRIDNTNTAIAGPHTIDPVAFQLRFNPDLSRLTIRNFPAIQTMEFDTPFGKNTTTVTRIGGGVGIFDPPSGHMEIPISLLFDQSLDIIIVEEDSRLHFREDNPLSTRQVNSPTGVFEETGSPLNRSTGEIRLVGGSVFEGGFPLGGSDASIEIVGSLSPVPQI